LVAFTLLRYYPADPEFCSGGFFADTGVGCLFLLSAFKELVHSWPWPNKKLELTRLACGSRQQAAQLG